MNIVLSILIVCILIGYKRQQVLAGIVGFKKSLYKRFPACFHQFPVSRKNFKFPIEVDHLCIDMNEILHRAFGKHDEILKRTKIFWNKIDRLVEDVAPKKSIIFAFDGPAPFAKLLLQRQRRMNDERAIITPGTELMMNMEYNMMSFLFRRFQRPLYSNLTCFLSSPNVPGEGELKIVDWIKNHMPVISSYSPITMKKDIFGNDTIVLFGGDSDIIVQSLASSRYAKNLYICSMENHKKQPYGVLCYVPDLVNAYYNYFNTPPKPYSANPLKLLPSNELSESNSEDAITSLRRDDPVSNVMNLRTQSINLICDIMFLTLLNGNDYLPKFRYYRYDKALQVYRNLTLLMQSSPPSPPAFTTINGSPTTMLKSSTNKFRLVKYVRSTPHPNILFSDHYSLKYNIHHLYLFFKYFSELFCSEFRFNQSSPTSSSSSSLGEINTTTTTTTTTNNNNNNDSEIPSFNSSAPFIEVNISPGQVIYELSTKKKFPVVWEVNPEKDMTMNPHTTNQFWSLPFQINNITIPTGAIFKNKKEGRHIVSLIILKLFFPTSYEKLMNYYLQYNIQLCDYQIDDEKYAALTETIRSQLSSLFLDGKTETVEPIVVKEGQQDKLELETAGNLEEDAEESEGAVIEEEIGEEEDDTYYDDQDDVGDESQLPLKVIIERIIRKSLRKPVGPCTNEDIINYLKGFLWILEMYLHGKCLDHSYFFQGRAPKMTEVIEFIEEYAINQSTILNLNSTLSDDIEMLLQHPAINQQFEKLLIAPNSNYSALSSEMSCVAVNPKRCESVVPDHLKPIWLALYQNVFNQRQNKEINYTILTDELQRAVLQSFNETVPAINLTTTDPSQINNTTSMEADSQDYKPPVSRKIKELQVFSPGNRLWKMIYQKNAKLNHNNNITSTPRYRGKFEIYRPNTNKLKRLIMPFHTTPIELGYLVKESVSMNS